jgi:hypothetical protein
VVLFLPGEAFFSAALEADMRRGGIEGPPVITTCG